MLTELANKIKSFWKANQRDLYLAALVFLVGMASFGLGRLSAVWPMKEPIRIDQVGEIDQSAFGLGEVVPADNFTKRSNSPTSPISSPQGNYVASRNGSAYHLPTCPGAKQIKDKNKIWFASAEAARAAGYKPAGNCPGLQ